MTMTITMKTNKIIVKLSLLNLKIKPLARMPDLKAKLLRTMTTPVLGRLSPDESASLPPTPSLCGVSSYIKWSWLVMFFFLNPNNMQGH